MLQRLDRSEKELGAVREKVQEFEAQDALNAARVKFVDKNMQDLEFLLEHAVQRANRLACKDGPGPRFDQRGNCWDSAGRPEALQVARVPRRAA